NGAAMEGTNPTVREISHSGASSPGCETALAWISHGVSGQKAAGPPQATRWPCATDQVAMTLCSAGLPPVLRQTCGLSAPSTAGPPAIEKSRRVGLAATFQQGAQGRHECRPASRTACPT